VKQITSRPMRIKVIAGNPVEPSAGHRIACRNGG
jgi:hypothetical protein